MEQKMNKKRQRKMENKRSIDKASDPFPSF